MNTPLVAIIGLPNSGKSTFFNKTLSRHAALTYPEAGTTRDRHYGLTTWNGYDFILVDTAGIDRRPDSELERNVQKQTAIAKDEADLIILMSDGKTQVADKDLSIAAELNRTKKPALLAVNKIEVRNHKTEMIEQQFQKLGLGHPFLVSSINGSGIGDLLDAIVKTLKKNTKESKNDYPDHLKLTFVGKPNVGKSSLINALLKQDRLLVHDQAGTTRSTIEIPFTYEKKEFLLLDTAGIKRKWKSDSDVAAAATLQALRTMNRTDVVFFVLDASSEITSQDQTIATEILEQNKRVLIVLNKSDLVTEKDQQKLLDKLPHFLPKLWWAPVVFTSAKTAHGLDKMLQLAQEVVLKTETEIEQENLDEFLDKILKENFPGKMDDQRAPKIYNLKQLKKNPPTFKLTVNHPAAIARGWKDSFEKQFRLKFGFEGSPVIMRYAKRT
jgi:GTPase